MHRMFIVLGLSSFLLLTYDTANAAGYTSYRAIDTIYVDGNVVIHFSSSSENPDSCGWGSYPDWYVLVSTQGGYSGILSTLLSASVANRNVKLLVDGCHTLFTGGVFPKITRVYLDQAE